MINTSDNAPPLPHQGGAVAWYACILMTLCLTLSLIDRSILSLLVAPIEREFGLSDSAMGLLIGGAFAISYAVLAVPFAVLSDRGDRTRLIALGLAVWCGATILSGWAKSAPMLFGLRIAVAAGEAVLMPAATSLLADYFSPAKRTRAFSVFGLGTFLGNGLAFVVGGALFGALKAHPIEWGGAPVEPWRAVLIVIGTIGFAFVPLVWLLRDPPRTGARGVADHVPAGDVFRHLRANKAALAAVMLGWAMLTLAIYAYNAWAPTIFIRAHGWAIKDAGIRLGLFALILGPLGLFSGSILSDLLARRGRADSKMIVGLLSAVICVLGAIVCTVASLPIALVGVGVLTLSISFNFGVQHAALVEVLPNRLWARGMAVYSALTQIFSITLGPLAVGLLTEHFFQDPNSIRLAVRSVAPVGFLVAAVIFAFGLRPYRRAVAYYRALATPADAT